MPNFLRNGSKQYNISSDKKSDDPIKDEGEKGHHFVHNGIPEGIGYWGSVAHIVRSAVGTGILLLPYEMKTLGYIPGTLILVAVTFVYFHILHILLDLNFRLREQLKSKNLTLALVADEIFAMAPSPFRQCRKPVVFLIYLYYITPIDKAIALILISTNIQEMAKFIGLDWNFNLVITGLSIFLCICCMFRSVFKALVPFSSASNLCSITIFIIVIGYSFPYRNPEGNVRPVAGDMSSVLRSMSICLNAAVATNVILPVNNAMEKPSKMTSIFGSLNMSAFIVGVLYTAFALIGYINFGDAVQENIFTNIPVSNLLILSINLVFSLALTVPYVLCFYANFDLVWSCKVQKYLADNKFKYLIEYGLRLSYHALAYVLALYVSDLSMIATFGGVIGIFLDVAIMPIMQLLLMYVLKERNYWILCKNMILIAFCSILFVLSVLDCVEQVSNLNKS